MQDVQSVMRKSENDLMRMVRKAIIHSRVVAPGGAARDAEVPPGGIADVLGNSGFSPRSADEAQRFYNHLHRRSSGTSDEYGDDGPNRRVRRPG